MSILDTFYILFKTDADEAAKDLKKVDDASDKAEAGLKKVDRAADGVGASFIKMAKSIAAPLLALASFGSLMSIATARAADIRQLDQFASKLNSSISDVDAFKRSVTGMGGEASQAIDSLVKLGEKVNEAFSDKDSGARKDFKEWGLAFKDAEGGALGASAAMLELAGNLETVSRAEALARIKKLGIEDAATIDLLLKGRRALEERIEAEKRMGVVTEDQARKVREYYTELGEVQNLLGSIGNQILGVFLPIASQAISIFGDAIKWMMENQTLVEGFFVGIASVLALKYTPAMIRAAAATIAALSPYLALIAAITVVGAAFALAYEDVRAFMDGQPSLIGALAEKYEWFGNIVKGIGEWFRNNPLAGWAAAAVAGLKLVGATAAGLTKLLGFTSVEAAAAAGTKWGAALGLAARVAIVAAFAGIMLEILKQFDPKGNLGGITKPIDDAIRRGLGLKPKDEGVTPGEIWRGITGTATPEERIDEKTSRPGRAEPSEELTDTARDLGFEQSEVFNPEISVEAHNKLSEALMVQAKEIMAKAASSPINGQTTQSLAPPVTNNDIKNTVNVGGVVIKEAPNAAAIASQIEGALSSKLRETASQFDDGVAR